MKRIAFLSILGVLISLTGCGAKSYTQRVINNSDQTIDDVVVHFGKLQSSFGVIPSQASASIMSMKTPPPKVARVTWTDVEGNSFDSEVELVVIPNDYNDGVLTFTIQSDSSLSVGFFIDTPVAIPGTK